MCTRARAAADPLSPSPRHQCAQSDAVGPFFTEKNALPLRRKGVRATQSVLDDLGDIGVEERLPFGFGRVPELFGV